jgi:hypothetical protein
MHAIERSKLTVPRIERRRRRTFILTPDDNMGRLRATTRTQLTTLCGLMGLYGPKGGKITSDKETMIGLLLHRRRAQAVGGGAMGGNVGGAAAGGAGGAERGGDADDGASGQAVGQEAIGDGRPRASTRQVEHCPCPSDDYCTSCDRARIEQIAA